MMRTLATALVLSILAGTAAAQCTPSSTAAADSLFLPPQPYGTLAKQPPALPVKAGAAQMIQVAARLEPRRTAPPAPQAKAQRGDEPVAQSDAAVYAALAVMAAIALRRRSR